MIQKEKDQPLTDISDIEKMLYNNYNIIPESQYVKLKAMMFNKTRQLFGEKDVYVEQTNDRTIHDLYSKEPSSPRAVYQRRDC